MRYWHTERKTCAFVSSWDKILKPSFQRWWVFKALVMAATWSKRDQVPLHSLRVCRFSSWKSVTAQREYGAFGALLLGEGLAEECGCNGASQVAILSLVQLGFRQPSLWDEHCFIVCCGPSREKELCLLAIPLPASALGGSGQLSLGVY